jgi:hypothetical protein
MPDSLAHPKRIDDPVGAIQQHAKNDRGGNVLLFLKHPHCPTTRTRENLHSAWDDCLVDVVNGAKGCVIHLQSHKDVAKGQLTKAAVHLADLLNQINWK